MVKNYLNILNSKITIGLVSTSIGSLIFAVLVRHTCLYIFNVFPVKEELTLLDINFCVIFIIFKFFFSALMEFCLEDTHSTALFE